MQTASAINWRELCKAGMASHDGFEALLLELEPLIVQMAAIYCPDDVEGAAQEARAHLYRIVFEQKRVDLERTDVSVGKFLSSLLRNQIRHEARRVSRKGMNCMLRAQRGQRITAQPQNANIRHARPEILPIVHAAQVAAMATEGENWPFPIPQYSLYFSVHGTIEGCAEFLAKSMGMDAEKLDKLFYRVAKTIRK